MNKRDLNKEYVNYYSLEMFNGYSKCGGNIDNLKRHASNLFQKRIRNEAGETLYFINVYEFDFTKYQEDGRYPKDMPVLKYSAEARFYRGEQEFNVDLLFLQNTTVADMEKFFAEVFQAMKCEPDKHNQ